MAVPALKRHDQGCFLARFEGRSVIHNPLAWRRTFRKAAIALGLPLRKKEIVGSLKEWGVISEHLKRALI